MQSLMTLIPKYFNINKNHNVIKLYGAAVKVNFRGMCLGEEVEAELPVKFLIPKPFELAWLSLEDFIPL